MAHHRRHYREHEDFYNALDKIREKADAKQEELIDLISNVYEKAKDTQEKATERVHHAASRINTEVHLHPWHYIGGATVFGFLVGLILARGHRNGSHNHK